MARFRYFSCIRSSKGETEGSSDNEHEYDEIGTGGAEAVQPESQVCVPSARVFKYTELAEATDTFAPSRVIGKGRLGRVYKGILQGGQEVAVKRFDKQADMLAEVDILTCVEHPNLVKMIGYCDEEEGHCIVYEFMPLQSLNLHLHDLQPGKKPLDWKTRMKIAEGVAKALEYLHDQKDPIVYGCLKKTGILLDENYHPKLSDFSCVNHVYISGHPTMYRKLTCGYDAPEYCITGRLTLKSDIYNLGVVLLELISGRKARDRTKIGDDASIVLWARPLLRASKKFTQIADPLMKGKYPHRGLVKALRLVRKCLQGDADERPLIAEVATTLSNLVSESPIYEEEARVTSEGNPFTPSNTAAAAA